MQTIKQEDLYRVLSKTTNTSPIKIKRLGEVLVVFLTKLSADEKVWARNVNETQDTLIFPTKKVQILKIGAHLVQTDSEYKKEKAEYLAFQRFLKAEEKRQLKKQAYIHSLKYPNID